MLDDVSGSFGMRFALAALAVGLAITVFFAAITYLRRRAPGTFAGFGIGAGRGMGRGRHHRLELLETVVLDARRRVILIRRDEVEHLLLVGGPADLVIENGISTAYQMADPEDDDEALPPYEDAPSPPPAALDRLRGRSPAPEKPAPPAYQEWQGDDSYDDLDLSDEGDDDLAGDFEETFHDYDRNRSEPPTGTIRPRTGSEAGRALAPPSPPMSDEEAAIARELEAARKRQQIPGPKAPVLGVTAARPGDDFNSAMEREMEQRLEAAKKQGQAGAAPRPVTLQTRRGQPADDATLKSGLAQLFGEGDPKG